LNKQHDAICNLPSTLIWLVTSWDCFVRSDQLSDIVTMVLPHLNLDQILVMNYLPRWPLTMLMYYVPVSQVDHSKCLQCLHFSPVTEEQT